MADSINQTFVLSNNESVVKNYRCTWSYHVFSKPELGFLTVTNKRVIYHSRSETSTGESTVLAEMPVEDVAGVSAFVGSSINWIAVIILTGVLYFLFRGLAMLLPSWVTNWALILFFFLPKGISLLIEHNILNDQMVSSVREQIETTLPEQLEPVMKTAILQRVVNTTFGLALFLTTIRLLFQSTVGIRVPILPFLLIGALVFWLIRTFSNRRRSFTLVLNSKTAQGSGIYIPGGGLSLFGGGEQTPGMVTASPAEDAEIIVGELGAMLTDIRLMGDLGLQKWTQAAPDKAGAEESPE